MAAAVTLPAGDRRARWCGLPPRGAMASSVNPGKCSERSNLTLAATTHNRLWAASASLRQVRAAGKKNRTLFPIDTMSVQHNTKVILVNVAPNFHFHAIADQFV